MSTPANTHTHYCTGCWELYECTCTKDFAPETYRCRACAVPISDDAFLAAIGVIWTDADPH